MGGISGGGTEIRLLVVTYRKSADYSERHILDRKCRNAFCGDEIPATLLDQLDDPRNPYVGKGTVTCNACLAEWAMGRREGFTDSAADSGTGVSVPGTEAVAETP